MMGGGVSREGWRQAGMQAAPGASVTWGPGKAGQGKKGGGLRASAMCLWVSQGHPPLVSCSRLVASGPSQLQ